MADIDDAEVELALMAGTENSWTGRVLIRLVRESRWLHNRLPLVGDRIKALEDRVAALESPPPQ